MNSPTALVMAGGTGGHIFPGLAIAEVLRGQGWQVYWMGAPHPSMESQLIPPKGFAFEAVRFGGVRGKGKLTLLLLPWRLLQAMMQSLKLIRRVKPDVLVGLGGYITFPGGLMGVVSGRPLVLHEQNAVAGMANQWLGKISHRIFSSFPNVLPKGEWVGNPLREEFLNHPEPAKRYAGRTGPLRVVVMGGSLGAQAINSVLPQALALIPVQDRPSVLHQAGEKHLNDLALAYAKAGVEAELTAFIDNPALAMAQADLVISRSGASTVSEIAAIGVAAIMVPFPFAVDDHQTMNAQFLSANGAGWLIAQHELSPQWVANQLQTLNRDLLLQAAQKAYGLRKTDAAEKIAQACREVLQ
jgi:UDP-N-acetylglucosamine--N-acetylmuramyl-(pentapeptide) pyrophosphoryl-undecaprenol N-acetylglucosamine transferase